MDCIRQTCEFVAGAGFEPGTSQVIVHSLCCCAALNITLQEEGGGTLFLTEAWN